jgi:pimeloyl-ACP methyl ester carboxylesterase
LGIERPILLASGFGGAVAIHYAATNPSRVMGLVLCHPALLDSSKEARGNLTKLKSLATVQTLAQCRRKPALTSPREDDPASAREARRQALRTAVLQVSWADTIRETEFLLGQSRATLLSGLAQIVCPILFAVSRDSGRYPPKAYMGLLDQLLQSKAATSARYGMTEFVGGFHPIWDEPTRFAQALNGFVQSLLPVDRHTHAWLLSEVDWPARETILWRCVHPECGKEIIEAVGCNPNDE